MKRGLILLLAMAACYWRGFHNGKRQFIGGQRCVDCERAMASLSEGRTFDETGPERA